MREVEGGGDEMLRLKDYEQRDKEQSNLKKQRGKQKGRTEKWRWQKGTESEERREDQRRVAGAPAAAGALRAPGSLPATRAPSLLCSRLGPATLQQKPLQRTNYLLVSAMGPRGGRQIACLVHNKPGLENSAEEAAATQAGRASRAPRRDPPLGPGAPALEGVSPQLQENLKVLQTPGCSPTPGTLIREPIPRADL